MKNKNGFTLIELLAVIVILGLLMAIAIPSVTKYITQSRKKTVVSTIGNYISATVNEVNDLTYTFTGNNTVYAVPIECIALERGGTNPFGHWLHANDAYWAYVLVQYDDETSSYTYGYTFKDSAGYGLYPTSQAKLNEQGKQIQTGLSLTRPANGKVTTITSTTNWSGFSVDSSTDLVVLTAVKEGEVGDGKTTCTLQQKGDNYASVEQSNQTPPVTPKPETPPQEEPANYICKRATTLHKNFGQLGTKGKLTSGDAFDCDVNGDGNFNATNERFYYVTDLEGNSNYAVLIYYSNVYGGLPVNTTAKNVDMPSVGSNVSTTFPKTSQWKNVQLTKTVRQKMSITGETYYVIVDPYKVDLGTIDYTGYASRLLTYEEARKALKRLK